MVAPPAVFVLVLILWPIVSLMIGNMIESGDVYQGAQAATIANIINVGLGFLGILSLIATPIGFLIGIVLLLKGKKKIQDSKAETVENTQ